MLFGNLLVFEVSDGKVKAYQLFGSVKHMEGKSMNKRPKTKISEMHFLLLWCLYLQRISCI